MDIPPEALEAKELLELPLFEAGLVTGVDIGLRDEENPDPEDLALRIYVADLNDVAPEVQAAADAFGFLPAVIIQRTFFSTQVTLPDTAKYRPLMGGVAVAATRFLAVDDIPTGTLGAIANAADPTPLGLSNFHVLAFDAQRNAGDEIMQPPGTAFDRIGALQAWAFPETTFTGLVDAAVCAVDVQNVPEVSEVGPVFGSAPATPGMFVSKRGITTGLTFGVVTTTTGSFTANHPQMPPVALPGGQSTTQRVLTQQLMIRADFPQHIVFGDHGDSGAVVLGPNNEVVGLYWGSGQDPDQPAGDPIMHGLACRIENVTTAFADQGVAVVF